MLRKQRQENHEFNFSMGCIGRPCLKAPRMESMAQLWNTCLEPTSKGLDCGSAAGHVLSMCKVLVQFPASVKEAGEKGADRASVLSP